MGIVFDRPIKMKKHLYIPITLVFLLTSFWIKAQTPESFLTHKVKKSETLEMILARYEITAEQLKEYNPSLERFGLRRKMNLRIPVYALIDQIEKPVQNKTLQDTLTYRIHEVLPKETKWRLAYQYKTTIENLDALNPEIRQGLKIGQKIRVPNFDLIEVIPERDTLYNYYEVLPKEGYYRIEKKLGINQATLDSLNPELKEKGLLAGMILKIPAAQTGDFMVKNDLLMPRVNLKDSLFQKKAVVLSLLLPFKSNEIEFDSIEDTERLLLTRNLHTLSLDFYAGALLAASEANDSGIDVTVNTFDTENRYSKLEEISTSDEIQKSDFIVGPLIPNNFDYFSNKPSLQAIPKIAPLSSNPVVFRKNIYQSITQTETFRAKMLNYLNEVIDSTHHVVIVADSLNRSIERTLKAQFPWAITLRPEQGDYILPELADSLLLDSIPNKIILETQSFPLIANALSQFNAQNTPTRNVQVFTTYRSNAYDNENLSRKILGGIQFTYPVGFKPTDYTSNGDFIEKFETRFGKPPNKEAVRGYDLVLDLILRTSVAENLENALLLGETQYQSNRFLYEPEINGAYVNKAFFLLQHKGYEIIEIKEWNENP